MEKLTKPQTIAAIKKLVRMLLLPRSLLQQPAKRHTRRGPRRVCDGQSFSFAGPLMPAPVQADEPVSPRVSCVGRVGGVQFWKTPGEGGTGTAASAGDKGQYMLKLDPVVGVELVEESTSVVYLTGDDSALELEKRPEVNLWKRRAAGPPIPLQV